MSKKISRIIGAVMLLAAIAFVAFAINNPQGSFPWSNTVTYLIYGVYAAVMIVLLIAPFKNKQQKLMLILAMILVLAGVSVSYKFIGTNDLRSKTYEFLETKGYTQNDISDMEIKHSFVNKLLGYNEWRIFVEFESEPEIIFAFTYRNQEIIREGVAGKEPLDKEAILEYENKFDHGKL